MADVLAIGYPDEATAAQVLLEVQRRGDELPIEPDAIAAIARGERGEYRVLTTHRAGGDGPSWGIFWTLLFALLFFVPVFGTAVGPSLAEVFGRFERNGIDRAFQQQARDMLTPGTSSLFLLTEGPVLGAVDLASRGYGGRVVSAPLTREQVSGLHEALYGRLEAPSTW